MIEELLRRARVAVEQIGARSLIIGGGVACNAGLRKAAARRLAEAGCTEHEIAAITGHASLREVARYTKAADQKKLATSAMEKVKARTSSG